MAVYDGSLHLCGSTDGSIYLELNYEWWPSTMEVFIFAAPQRRVSMYLEPNFEWWPSTMEVSIFAVPQRRIDIYFEQYEWWRLDGSLHLCGSTDGSIYLELNYEWWPSTMEVFIFAVPQMGVSTWS
ncbi:hypothetical protein J6590_032608 [Homalodisca vitripennis]|nr:hypothetical protein J6590_032608 [Homalodisca vitripennis]